MLAKDLLLLALRLSTAVGSALTLQDPEHQQPLGLRRPDDKPSVLEPSTNQNGPAYRDDLLSLHKQLVQIPSTTGTEHDVGHFLIDYLSSKSWQYKIQQLPPKRNTPVGKHRFNVIAWPGSSSAAKSKVLVTSHIDTVPPHIPYYISEGNITKDTVIGGRGSVDAKGSVAAQLTAVNQLLASGDIDPDDVLVLYVVGEEEGGDGMRAFSDAQVSSAPPFKAAIFGEPTENKLACGHKGILVCEVTAQGLAGHSGYPWLGKSANEVLMRGLVNMLDTDLGSTDKYGNTTVNVGIMGGGVAGNVIPAHASATLTCRIALEPQESGHTSVLRKMEEVLASVDDDALSLDCLPGTGVVACDCEVAGFDTFVANYGTDIPHLKGDHTRYLYGPGTILVAHGDNEAFTVRDLEEAVEGNMKLILHALKL